MLTMTSPLEKEQALYEEKKQELLAEGEGKYVVIKGDIILKFFSAPEDALRAGSEAFGALEPFLVRQVLRVSKKLYFSPSPLHNAMFNNAV